MASATHISRFTPSVMLPATLEAIFVQRHKLADDTVARIREGALRGNRPQLLFVGPRGCGKTHFVSLVFHRIRAIPELEHKLRIAWLNEDETATSFLDLQVRVYRALSKDYPEEFPSTALERIQALGPRGAEDRVSKLILKGLGDRNALILVENLDQLLEEMGEEGQHRWRAHLQESGCYAIVATAQQIVPAVASREAPFFGAFLTSYFQPLDEAQGRELLSRIATVHEDHDLQSFLTTPRGRARVRALQHLSGGNHRVYVVLSEFLSRSALDDLIGLFEKTLDELTPYYQERLRWLSPQQRKIVEILCVHGRPMPVKDIATAIFSTNQVVSGQLKSLKEKRYVHANTRGRESLYELSEPLMRMAMELKEHRGGPIRLVVDFLRIWYDREQLDRRLRELPSEARLERMHVAEALRRIEAGEMNPCVAAVEMDLDRFRKIGDPKRTLEALEDLTATRGTADDWLDLAEARWRAHDPAGASDALTRVIHLEGTSIDQLARALCNRGVCTSDLGDSQGAIDDYTRVVELDGAPLEQVALALFNRGVRRGELGDSHGEIDDYNRVIELDGAPVEGVARALVNRGVRKGALGDSQGAIDDYSRVIELDGAPLEQAAMALLNRGVRKGALGDSHGEIDDYDRVIEFDGAPVEQVAGALVNRGLTKGALGDSQGAIDDYNRLIELDGAPLEKVALALFNRGFRKSALGDSQGAIDDYSRVTELDGAPLEKVALALFNRGVCKGALGDSQGEIADYNRVIELDGAPVEQVAWALFNRGVRKSAFGDSQGAINDYNRVTELEGASVEPVAWALFNRGVRKGTLGDIQGEIDDYSRVTELEGAPVGDVASAFVLRCRARFRRGEWGLGWEDLHESMRHPQARAEQARTEWTRSPLIAEIIQTILDSTNDTALWRERVTQLVATFTATGFLPELGAGLVRSARNLLESKRSEAALRGWREVWREAAATHQGLGIPLEIFHVAIDYVLSRDPKKLFDLPIERRAILEQLFEIKANG